MHYGYDAEKHIVSMCVCVFDYFYTLLYSIRIIIGIGVGGWVVSIQIIRHIYCELLLFAAAIARDVCDDDMQAQISVNLILSKK